MFDRKIARSVENDTQFMWHPMASPMVTHGQTPLVVQRGEGVNIWDADGNKYFDAMSGLWCVNVGHGRPEIKQAIKDQLDELEFHNTFLNMTHPKAIALAKQIVSMLDFEGMERVFFSSGGSDAVESALKIARMYWRMQGQAQRTKFIALSNCYHGMHFGGTALNGSAPSRAAVGPTLDGVYHVETPHLFRNPWTSDPEELGEICARLLENAILAQSPDTVAAFIAEPIQGIGGVIVPPENYWPRVREICDKYGILLIADEVVTGFGRSGSMSGSRGWGVKPDIMCLAKGLTSGYVPMGATALGPKVVEAFENTPPPKSFVLHGYTYSGHPVAAAAGLASLEIVERENLPANAAQVGAYMIEGLNRMRRFAHVGDVRGKGLMAAIELVADRKTLVPLAMTDPFGAEIGRVCRENGALVRAVGSLLIFSPPLISTTQDIDVLLNALEAAFTELDEVVE